MFRLCAGLGVVGLWLACASSPAENAGPSFELREQKAFLYEVTRPGSDDVVIHLLGSVHMLDVPLRLGPGIRDRFEAADALVVELDPTRIDAQAAADLVIRYGMLEYGEHLEDLLQPETRELLLARLEQPDFSADEREFMLRLRPWAIGLMIEQKNAAAVASEAHGVEVTFVEAAGSRLPVLELETADEQFYAMSSLSDRFADQALRDGLQAEAAGVSVTVVLDAWKSGDETALAAVLFGDESPTTLEVYAVFILARNEKMSLGLQDFLEQAPDRVLFAIVGAAHVIGADGVPAMLRAEGFEVRRVR